MALIPIPNEHETAQTGELADDVSLSEKEKLIQKID